MITGRPKPTLTLTADEQVQLCSFAASRTLPHALVARAELVLWSAAGQSNTHRHQEFLTFLRHLDRNIPSGFLLSLA